MAPWAHFGWSKYQEKKGERRGNESGGDVERAGLGLESVASGMGIGHRPRAGKIGGRGWGQGRRRRNRDGGDLVEGVRKISAAHRGPEETANDRALNGTEEQNKTEGGRRARRNDRPLNATEEGNDDRKDENR